MKRINNRLSEKEIDDIVVMQADDNSAWENPIRIKKTKSTNLSLPYDLAIRASFLAKLHKEKSLEKWLKRIIQERIEIEEVAFSEVKKEMSKPKKIVKQTRVG